MATNYPIEIDSSLTIPVVADNATPVSAAVANTLRDAIIAIETELGIKPSGLNGTIRERLDTLESAMIVGSISVIPSGAVGGDLSGSLPNPTVSKINGTTIPPLSSLTQGDILFFNGTGWTRLGPGTSGYVLTTNGVGANPSWNATAATFAAGGDLSGTATNQTVIKINGTSVPSTPSANQVLIASSSSASAWNLIANVNVSASAAIAGTKINPDFGAQTVKTTADGYFAHVNIGASGSTYPSIGQLKFDTVSFTGNRSLAATRTLSGSANIDLFGVDEYDEIVIGSVTNPSWTSFLVADTMGYYFGDNTGGIAYFTRDYFTIAGPYLTWVDSAVNPQIFQYEVTTAAATGQPLSINAQNATGTGATVGGKLILKSGTGATNGDVEIRTGATTKAVFSPASTTLNGTINLSGLTASQYIKTDGSKNLVSSSTISINDLSVGSQTRGDIIYYNGTSWTRLGAGTDGYVLTTHGTTANPTWEVAATGGGTNPWPYLQVGSGPYALTGNIRVPNNTTILSMRNALNTSDITLVSSFTDDALYLGGDAGDNNLPVYTQVAASSGILLRANSDTQAYVDGYGITVGTGYSINMGWSGTSTNALLNAQNNKTIIGARNAGDTADIAIAGTDNSNILYLGGNSADAARPAYTLVGATNYIGHRIGSTTYFTVAAGEANFINGTKAYFGSTGTALSGNINTVNNTTIIAARNFAGDGDLSLLTTDVDNTLYVGGTSSGSNSPDVVNIHAASGGYVGIGTGAVYNFAVSANQLAMINGANMQLAGAGCGTSGYLNGPNNATLLTARNAAGTADLVAIASDASNNIIIGSTLKLSSYGRGTLITNGSGVVSALGHGTSGYVLTSNGAGSDPSWQAPTGGGGGSNPWSYLQVGTTPFASVGLIRAGSPSVAGNREILNVRNTNDDADYTLISFDTDDYAYIGGNPAGSKQPPSIMYQTTGAHDFFVAGAKQMEIADGVIDTKEDLGITFKVSGNLIPATVGMIRTNNQADGIIVARNFADTDNVAIITYFDDQLGIGGSAGGIFDQPDGVTHTATNMHRFYVGSSGGLNKVTIDSSGQSINGVLTVVASNLTPVAGTGDIRVANNTTIIAARNALDTANLPVIATDSSDKVVIGSASSTLKAPAYGRGVLLSDASGNISSLTNGTSGYVLTSNGAGSDPTWQPVTGGGGSGTNPWAYLQIGTVGDTFATSGGIRTAYNPDVIISVRDQSDLTNIAIVSFFDSDLGIGGTAGGIYDGPDTVTLTAGSEIRSYIGGGRAFSIDSLGIAIGSPTDYAATGAIRTINNALVLAARNSNSDGDLELVKTNDEDGITFGDEILGDYLYLRGGESMLVANGEVSIGFTDTEIKLRHPIILGAAILNQAQSGDIRVANNVQIISSRTAENDSDTAILATDDGNNVWLGSSIIDTDKATRSYIAGSVEVVIRVNGTDKLTVDDSTLTTTGGRVVNVSSLKTANYTITTSDYLVGVGTLATPITLTLPASPVTGQCFEIKDVNGSAATYNITVTTSDSKNIDGATSYILAINYSSIRITYTGTQWSIT